MSCMRLFVCMSNGWRYFRFCSWNSSKCFSIASVECFFIQKIVPGPHVYFLIQFLTNSNFLTADAAKRIQRKIPNLLPFISSERLNKFLTSPKSQHQDLLMRLNPSLLLINLVSKYALNTFWRAITWFTLCTMQFVFCFSFFGRFLNSFSRCFVSSENELAKVPIRSIGIVLFLFVVHNRENSNF